VIRVRRFGSAGGGCFEPEERSMARPTPDEKSQLVSLICQINAAIRELERYLAEQREIIQRREGAGVGAASADRRQSSGKSALM